MIDFPNSLLKIGDRAFQGCILLKDIKIPNSVTELGNAIFKGCSYIESMTIPFVGASRSARSTYDQVFGWIFGYSSYYGATNNKSSDTIYQCKVQNTSNRAYFYNYYIPSSITSVTITGGTINDNSFTNCTMINKVLVCKDVTTLGYEAFYGCNQLQYIEIEEGLSTIGERAFGGCTSLSELVIPQSLTKILRAAFKDCELIKSIYYKGSASEWGNINIYYSGEGNHNLSKATLYLYIEDIDDLPDDNGNYWHYVDGMPMVWEKE